MAKAFKTFSNFTQVPNIIVNDHRVSLKAKGLYLYFCSKPDGWDFTLNGMTSQLKESKTSILSAINELCNYGYFEKIKNRSNSGRFLNNDYLINEYPFEAPQNPSKSKNRSRKNGVGKTESENHTTSNTITSNTKKSNTISTNGRERFSFSDFRDLFIIESDNKTFSLSEDNGTGFRSDTVFKIVGGLIYNQTANKYLTKDDAFKVWTYLFERFKDGAILKDIKG